MNNTIPPPPNKGLNAAPNYDHSSRLADMEHAEAVPMLRPKRVESISTKVVGGTNRKIEALRHHFRMTSHPDMTKAEVIERAIDQMTRKTFKGAQPAQSNNDANRR